MTMTVSKYQEVEVDVDVSDVVDAIESSEFSRDEVKKIFDACMKFNDECQKFDHEEMFSYELSSFTPENMAEQIEVEEFIKGMIEKRKGVFKTP